MLALVLSACGGVGTGSDNGEEPGAAGGWVSDKTASAGADPAAATADNSQDTSEGSAEESRMTTTLVGDTEVVTYRPYLDDGSLAPGFDEHASDNSPWVCRPWHDRFHACRQVGYEDSVVVYFCSTNGTTAWCPSPMAETIFSRMDNIRVLDEPETTMQVIDPAPVRLKVEGMDYYNFAASPEMERPDATVHYRTQGPVPLWAPTGRSAIDAGNGTWTVYRASSGSQTPFESLPVARAVVLK